MEEQIVYFEKPGPENTETTIRLALKRAADRKIGALVVASTRGGTAAAVADAIEGKDFKLVIVPWQFGFKGKENPFPKDLTRELRAKGHCVHFGTMLFHTTDLYGDKTPQAMANALRVFGQGIKVCVEIIMMACDGGWLDIGEKVIAVSGTNVGADTAVVATAAPSTSLTALRIHEIICKPLL